MTDINSINPIPTPGQPEIKPVSEPVVPTPSVPAQEPVNQLQPDQAASRLKSEPEQAKVLTVEEVYGKPRIIALALVALFVLAGAATAFYLSTLGSAKPQNAVVEGAKAKN